MPDKSTIEAYDKNVEDYFKIFDAWGPDKDLKAFMEKVSPGGFILDLGCGPANASAQMKAQGFSVDPMDASSEMIRKANEVHDIGARLGTFDDIHEIDTYDGVWANFSLLHAPRAKFPKYLKRIHSALKDEGIFHIGMKLGTGEGPDHLGRYYIYYEEAELTDLIANSGFSKLSTRTGKGKGLAGTVDPWIIMLWQKN